MMAALFVGGPAVILAIMAWAFDRFSPVTPTSLERDKINGMTTVTRSASGMEIRSRVSIQGYDAFRDAFDAAESANESVPLAQALQQFDLNRRRSMDRDHYPDSKISRYQDLDTAESRDKKLIFQKDGRMRLEDRLT